jgi:Group 4 capsule polysaccharide lipoprotein gfcB, YjbF
MGMQRLKFFAAFFLPILSACTGTFGETPDFHRDPESTIPMISRGASVQSTAMLGLMWGYSFERPLMLDAIEANRLFWYGEGHVLVVTDGGRIQKTVGLPANLGGSRLLSREPGNTTERSYSADFPDLNIFGTPVVCKRQDFGDAAVRISEKNVPTRHIVEHCSSFPLNWTFDNEYWEDRETHYIWRSCQHVHPDTPPVMLEVLRPEPGRPEASNATSRIGPAPSALLAPGRYDCAAR